MSPHFRCQVGNPARLGTRLSTSSLPTPSLTRCDSCRSQLLRRLSGGAPFVNFGDTAGSEEGFLLRGQKWFAGDAIRLDMHSVPHLCRIQDHIIACISVLDPGDTLGSGLVLLLEDEVGSSRLALMGDAPMLNIDRAK